MDSRSRPATATIASLPNEILSHILGSFRLHRCDLHKTPWLLLPRAAVDLDADAFSWYTMDRQALYSMCLVSKRF